MSPSSSTAQSSHPDLTYIKCQTLGTEMDFWQPPPPPPCSLGRDPGPVPASHALSGAMRLQSIRVRSPLLTIETHPVNLSMVPAATTAWPSLSPLRIHFQPLQGS